MTRTLYHATAAGEPESINGGCFSVVDADTAEGRQRVVIKPTRDAQQGNFAWAFNEFVAGRLAVALGIDALRPYVLHGLQNGPLVGIPFQANARQLHNEIQNPAFSWTSVVNSGTLLEVAAFDLCVFNSDREATNLFLIPQGGSKYRLVAFDHEKSLIGNGNSDLHRIRNTPTSKNIGDFIKPWLRQILLGFWSASDCSSRITESVDRFTRVLLPLWELVYRELPSEWMSAVPSVDLEIFLALWWRELPSLCATRLKSILGN